MLIVDGHCLMYFRVGTILFLNIMLLTSCASKGSVEDQMQSILDDKIKQYGIHGVSATVTFPSGEIWTGVSGLSHDTVTIKPDMVFGIGSITKNIIAALTLKLAEDSILLLEDSLSNWLPKYRHVDGNITIRQLLNHTSGIYMFWDNPKIWEELKKDRSRVWSPEEVLGYIKEPYFKAGERWRYSNTNYLLLAMIIEKATGSKLSSELNKYFWKPLGIDPIYLSQEDNTPNNQAHIYGDNFQFGDSNADLTFVPRASHESITFGSSGIFTTSENLARWCHTLFEGQILQPRSLNEMLQFVEFNSVANMRAYGLGVQEYARSFSSGKKAIGHGGGNIGSSTYMVYFPEYHISIVVMINAYPNAGVDAITKGLIRIVLRDLNAIGIIPYFDFFPFGFLMACIAISVSTVIIATIIRKRKSLQG